MATRSGENRPEGAGLNEPTLVYSGRTNWPLIGVGVAAFAALVTLGRPWDGPWPGMAVPLAVAFGLFGIVALTTTSLRVTTGPRGVQVRWGVFGWPGRTYPPERIAAVEIVEVSPWKSWEYGTVWTRRGGWSFVLRSGPALRLTLTNQRRVTVGVEDPQAALAALGGDPVPDRR